MVVTSSAHRPGPSRRVTWQEVVDYAPDLIILMPCSLELERVAAEFELLCDRVLAEPGRETPVRCFLQSTTANGARPLFIHRRTTLA